MRAIGKKEAKRMFGRLKERFGRKKQPTASYNRREAHERCVQRILRIHYMAIVTSGEERERGLEDAVINPMAFESFCDWIELCPDCFSKAAMAIDYIANFHPFAEGNKRTAFQLAIALLRNGGYELDDDTATASFIIEVASGLYSREEIEEWLRRNTHQVIL